MEEDGGKASDAPPTDQSEVPKGAASGPGKGQVQGKQAGMLSVETNGGGQGTKGVVLPAVQAPIKPMVVLTPNGVNANGVSSWNATHMPQVASEELLVKKSQPPVSGVSVSPVRSSKMMAALADQDSLEKATKLKARKNLDMASKGTTASTSFSALDDSEILQRTQQLGVSFGPTQLEATAAINLLRETESNLGSLGNLQQGRMNRVDDAVTDCSNDDYLDLETLNLICSEVGEYLGDGGCDPIDLHTPLSPKQSRKSKGKKKKKRYTKSVC